MITNQTEVNFRTDLMCFPHCRRTASSYRRIADQYKTTLSAIKYSTHLYTENVGVSGVSMIK